jgi:CheY-like chemotaxis protein
VAGPATGITVLIAEDDASFRELLTALIAEETGGEALAVADGCALLALAAERRPDLVVLDLAMPGVDGWEACRRLKGDPTTAGIPVLVVSGANACAVQSLGCDGYVQKPVDLDGLIDQVRRLVPRPIEVPGSRLARESTAAMPRRLATYGAAVADAKRRCEDCRAGSRALLARPQPASARRPSGSAVGPAGASSRADEPLDAIVADVRAHRDVMEMLARGIAVGDGNVEVGVDLMMLRLRQGNPADSPVADTLISYALRLVEAEAKAAAEAEARQRAAARPDAVAPGRGGVRGASAARATAQALSELAAAIAAWRSASRRRGWTAPCAPAPLLTAHRELVAEFQALHARGAAGELDPSAHAAFRARAARLAARLRAAT